MSSFSILAYKPDRAVQTTEGPLEVFWMDATISVAPTFSSTVTKHPTEDRDTISDHVILQNLTMSITGSVSNAPYQTMQNNVIPASGDRVKRAYQLLVGLYKERRPFTIVAELDTYENCIITSLSMPQDAMNAEALKVEMSIEQIRIANNPVNTSVYAFNTENELRGKKNTDEGEKSPAFFTRVGEQFKSVATSLFTNSHKEE